jgi:hypothetical protein
MHLCLHSLLTTKAKALDRCSFARASPLFPVYVIVHFASLKTSYIVCIFKMTSNHLIHELTLWALIQQQQQITASSAAATTAPVQRRSLDAQVCFDHASELLKEPLLPPSLTKPSNLLVGCDVVSLHMLFQLHQLLTGHNKNIIMDIPPKNATSSTQGSRLLCSPMTGTSTPLDGLAAIAAAVEPLVAADSSSQSSLSSWPTPSPRMRMMMTGTWCPHPPMGLSEFSPSAVAPRTAYPMTNNNGALQAHATSSSYENQAGDLLDTLHLLLARQQQQQKQREPSTRYSLLYQDHSALSFPCCYQLAAREQALLQTAQQAAFHRESVAASHRESMPDMAARRVVQQQLEQQQQQVVSWLAQQQREDQLIAEQSAAAAAVHDAAVVVARYLTDPAARIADDRLMQHMLMQKTTGALTREVTLATRTVTARRSDDRDDDNDGYGSNLRNNDHRPPTEMMCCTRLTKNLNEATESAAHQDGFDVSRQPLLTTMINSPSSSHCVQDTLLSSLGAGPNRHGVISDASLITTRQEVAVASSSAPALTNSSTTHPNDKLRIARITSMQNPPKRALSAYNIFFKHERARLIGQEEVHTAEEEGNENNCSRSTEKEEQVVSSENLGAAASSTKEGSSGARKRKKPATNQAPAAQSIDKQKKRKTIGFALLAQTIATTWKAMDETSRKKYDALSREDKRRYETEFLAYKAHQEVEWQRNHQEKLARL